MNISKTDRYSLNLELGIYVSRTKHHLTGNDPFEIAGSWFGKIVEVQNRKRRIAHSTPLHNLNRESTVGNGLGHYTL